MSKRKSSQGLHRQYQRRQQRRVDASTRQSSATTGKIIAAYVPIPTVWQATGYGTVAIVREDPQGTHRYAFAVLDLQRGGLHIPGGKKDIEPSQSLVELNEFLEKESIPAGILGDPVLAGKILFGAYAYSLERGFSWPVSSDDFFQLFPRAIGYTGDWLRWLRSPESGISRPLWRLVDNQPDLWDEIPEGKEPVVCTRITLSAPDPRRLIDLLLNSGPDFACDDDDGDEFYFTATRAYPKTHWNPISRMKGARQTIGHVSVTTDSVVVESSSLSFTARILTLINRLYGSGLEVHECEYDDVNLRQGQVGR